MFILVNFILICVLGLIDKMLGVVSAAGSRSTAALLYSRYWADGRPGAVVPV